MNANLRTLVLRGGAYLSLRQVLGLSISFGGLLLLIRAIGPEDFGLYASAFSIFTFLQIITYGGIQAFLVRRKEGEDRTEVYHQAFTLLLVLSAGETVLIFLGLPLLEKWVRMPGFGPVALAVFLSLPIAVLSQIPIARLERALDYKRIAMFELAGGGAYYLVALPLAFGGFGVMAPIAGLWSQWGLVFVLVFSVTRYRPRLHWDPALARSMIRYGASYTGSSLIFQSRELVNPLVVGRYLGPEAVAYVALAVRFVKGLSFVKDAAWRLSIAALSRIQQDRVRLVRAVSEGMRLQVLAQGPIYVGFGLVAGWFLPFISGSDWLQAMEVYPFIALGALVNAVFNLHSSALYTLRRNLRVVTFSLTHIILFAGSALVLVPSVGVVGYGLAEIVALASYAVIHINFVRVVEHTPTYLLAGAWLAAAALALFVHELGWWALLGPAFVLLWPRTWQELGGYVRMFSKVREA